MSFGFRIKSLFFSLLVLSFFFPAGTSEARDKEKGREEQKKRIESQLLQEKKKLESFNLQERDVLAELASLEAGIEEKRAEIRKIERSAALLDKDTGALGEKLDTVLKELDRTESFLSRKLVSLYKYVRRDFLAVLADASGLSDLERRARYLKIVMENDHRLLMSLDQTRGRLREDLDSIRKEISEKRRAQEKEKERLDAIEKDLDERVLHLMKIHREKEFYETAVKELQIAARDFGRTIEKIEKKGDFARIGERPFEHFRGKLPPPVEGKAVKCDTVSQKAVRKRNRGIFIEGAPGAAVRSIYPGRVDFSGKLKGYGELIIVNHGSRIFTVSGQLARRTAQEGDMVEAGQVIGFLGKSGKPELDRLYFEIRKSGRGVDTLKWLRVK